MHGCQLICHNQAIIMEVAKQWLFHVGSSCRIETSLLICYVNQWTGFCIIGTSVMKDSRRSSSTYNESLFLHVVKHNLLFLFLFVCLFFFYLAFLSWIFTIHRTAGEEGGYSLFPFYPFHPLHRHLDISWVIAIESEPLRIAGSRNQTWTLWYTLFTIHSFYTCTSSCCCYWRMLKIQVTLGNISRASLNLTKRSIFAMFKELTVIFSL